MQARRRLRRANATGVAVFRLCMPDWAPSFGIAGVSVLVCYRVQIGWGPALGCVGVGDHLPQ